MRRALALMGAMAAGTLFAISNVGTAHADPYDCRVGPAGRTGGFAICENGTGEYRVRIRCHHSQPLEWDYYKYGPWVRTGNYSFAYCNADHVAYNETVQVR